jgi:hypothetical protein
MAVNGVSYANPYAGYVNFEGRKDHKKDFVRPKHPGLICPPEIEAANRKRQAKVIASAAGIVTAGVLAFVFRGKIKNAYRAVKPFVKNAGAKIVEYGKKGFKKAKVLAKKGVSFIKPAIVKAKDVAVSAFKAVKGLFTKAKVKV